MQDKREQMKKIRDQIMEDANLPLYAERVMNGVLPVIGEGSHDAEIIFVGEAPGKNEAKTGRPFCGAAGKILDELLKHINLDRQKVYITNIVKERPPNNRDPKPEEIEAYAPFLEKQIEIINPKVVVGLGRFSSEFLMNKFGLSEKYDSIGKIHGQIFDGNDRQGELIKIIPLYHPAAAIYNRHLLKDLKEDFEKMNIAVLNFLKKS